MKTPKFNIKWALSNEGRTLLIIALGIVASLFTYEVKAQRVSFGPKLGISSTTGAGDDLPDGTESITGFVGGAFLKANVTPYFAIQPELLLHQKGGYWEYDNNNNYRLRSNYLEIPILFKAQIPLSKVKPFVYAGPYGAFVMSNTTEGELFGFNDQGTAQLNDFDAGAVFGGGVDVTVGALYLGFDLRYGVGMTNIYDRDDESEEPDIKNRSFNAMVSLGINL